METETRHWWQQLMDGELGRDDPMMPAFVEILGIVPTSWDDGAGTVTMSWEPPGFTRTPGGWVQGGFLGVVLDMAQTFALMTKLPVGSMPQTLEMKVSYLDGSWTDRYTVTARALRWGKRAAHTDAELTDLDGKPIATSTATHVVRQMTGEQLRERRAPS